MSSFRVSRRQLVGMVATAAAVVPALSSTPAVSAPATQEKAREDLLAPLQPGSPLGEWTIVAIGSVRAGALSLALKDVNGVRFFVDICKRDDAPGAAQPPARTDLYDLFLSNDGDGATATTESHGLATFALAEIVRSNEHSVRLDGMLTRQERLARFAEQVAEGYMHLA